MSIDSHCGLSEHRSGRTEDTLCHYHIVYKVVGWFPGPIVPPGCVRTCFNQCKEKIANGQISDEHIVNSAKTSDAADCYEDDEISKKCQVDDDRYIHYLYVPQDHGIPIGGRWTVKDTRMREIH